MRKIYFSTLMAGTLLLGGCAAGAGGLGGNPLGAILGSVLAGAAGGGQQQQNLSQFERAAIDACGQQAQQYGRVGISDVRQTSNDFVQVIGRIETNDGYQREFTCTFRSDGRIVDFRAT